MSYHDKVQLYHSGIERIVTGVLNTDQNLSKKTRHDMELIKRMIRELIHIEDNMNTGELP